MIVQPSSFDPADTSSLLSLDTTSRRRSLADRLPWSRLALRPARRRRGRGRAGPSLRSIALARRSLGIEPMSSLTDLPSLRRRLVAPNQANGAQPVGAAPSALAVVAPAASVPAVVQHDPWRADDHWHETESLDSYLDRRLLQARALYLPNRGRAYAAFKRLLDIVGALVLLLADLAGHAGPRGTDPPRLARSGHLRASSG